MKILYDKYFINNATLNDVDLLLKWWNDGKIMEHAGFPNGLNETREGIQKSLQKDNEDNRRLIISYDHTPIGEMNYKRIGDRIAEIGIKICEFDMQNKGHGTMFLTLLIDCLFNNYNYNKIILDTNLNNKRAQYFYENKLGFKKIRVNKDAWYDQLGRIQSSVDYELDKIDWKKIDIKYYII